MKKALKITGIIIVLLIAALIITPFFFKDEITKLAKEEINKNVNAKVDFKDVGLSLFQNFPNFTFSLDELSVIGINNFKDKTLLKSEKISLTIDLGSVFSGNYIVKEILIKNSDINISILKGGKSNYDIAKSTELADTVIEADTTTSNNAFAFAIKHFEISNANIIYDDQDGNMKSIIKGFDLVLSGNFTQDDAKLKLETSINELSYKMDNIPYLKKAKLNFDAEILTDLDSSKYIFKENAFKINGLALNFDGFVAMPGDDIYTDIKFNAPKATFKSLLSMIPAFYMEGFEDIKTDGKFSMSGWAKGFYSDYSYPAFDLKLNVEDANFQYPDLPKAVKDIAIRTHISSPSSDLNDMLIDVSKFHFSIAKNPMDITLKLKTPLTDPNIDAGFKGKMNLATLKQVYPMDDGMQMSGVFKTNIKLKGKQSDLDKGRYQKFKASGNMQITELSYKDADLPEGVVIHKANMEFTPRFINLTEFNTTYNKNTLDLVGRIQNYMSYALSDGTLKGSFKMSADYLNMDELMASNSDETETQDASQSKETTEAETPNEEATAFEVPDNIDVTMQCIIGRLRYDNINIKTIYGVVKIANKQVEIENLKMELLGGKMEMSGYYSSADIKKPFAHFALGVHNFDFKKTYNSLDMVKSFAPIMQYAKGSFSSVLSYEGELDNEMSPKLETVNAKGVLSTSQLTIKGAKSIEELANTLRIKELKTLTTKAMSIPYEIKDGKLTTKPFTTEINGMPLTANGVTYLNQDIDYDLNMKIPREKLGGEANKLINGLISQANSAGANMSMTNTINVKAHIIGTTTKPKVDLDIKKATQNAANTVKEEVKKEVKKQVEDLKKKAQEEADKVRKEAEARAKAEIEKRKKELEKKKEEEKKRLKKKLEEEAKKKLGGWF